MCTKSKQNSAHSSLAVLLGIGLGLLPNISRADSVVNSSFVFQLNDSIFASPEFSLASALSGSQTFAMPDTVFQDVAPVTVSGISVQTTYAMTSSTPQIYLGADIALVSKSLNVSILINSISINGDIVSQVGSTTVVSHVQGQCTNIPITLQPGAAQLVGSILTSLDASGLPVVTIPWFQAQWGAGAWSFGSFNCTGVAGFQAKVVQALTNYLASPQPFNVQLKAMLDAKAAQYQAQARAWFAQPKTFAIGVSGLNVTMTPKSIQNLNGENFQLTGTLSFDFASSKVKNSTSVVATTAAPLKANGFALLLPEGLTNALNSAAYATGAYQTQQLGQQIAGFQSLLASGLDEFFVWPELSNYPATANFIFDVSASSQPSLSAFTDNGNGTLSQNVRGSVYVVTEAPQASGGTVPMTMFSSPVTSTCQLSLAPTATGSQLNLAFSNMSLNVTAAWDNAYIAAHHPNTYIGTLILQSNVVNAMQTSGLSLQIGKLALTSTMNLSASSLQKAPGWLQIDWQ